MNIFNIFVTQKSERVCGGRRSYSRKGSSFDLQSIAIALSVSETFSFSLSLSLSLSHCDSTFLPSWFLQLSSNPLIFTGQNFSPFFLSVSICLWMCRIVFFCYRFGWILLCSLLSSLYNGSNRSPHCKKTRIPIFFGVCAQEELVHFLDSSLLVWLEVFRCEFF